MRTIIFILLSLCFGLAGCGSSSVVSNDPVSLDGRWTAERFSAEIAGGQISIDLVNSKTETSSVYWVGTAPLTASEGEFVSTADRAILDKSMLGSRDSTKTFTYEDGVLTFVFGVMGTKTTVHLSRV